MFVWLSVHFCVIARSVSDEAIKTFAQAYWIASLTLAMTRDNSRYVFIRPRDSGGGGPPVGRWRGGGRVGGGAGGGGGRPRYKRGGGSKDRMRRFFVAGDVEGSAFIFPRAHA